MRAIGGVIKGKRKRAMEWWRAKKVGFMSAIRQRGSFSDRPVSTAYVPARDDRPTHHHQLLKHAFQQRPPSRPGPIRTSGTAAGS
jgi:hypothetical protein